MTKTDTTVQEVIKAAPTVSVGSLALGGVALADWVLIVSLIWTIVLIIDKLPSLFQNLKKVWRWFHE